MSEQFYTLLTETGQSKLVNSVSGGHQVRLTHLAVGDANEKNYEPSTSQTALSYQAKCGQRGHYIEYQHCEKSQPDRF